MLGVLFYHLGAFFSRILPRPAPQVIAWIIGEANWRLRPYARRVVTENLMVIHEGEMEYQTIRKRARRVVMNFAKGIQIFLELPFFSQEELDRRGDFTEFEKVAAELEPGKPFILASAHVGPWELGGYYLKRLGYRVHTVALEHPSPHVTQWYSERRALVGVQAHPLHNSFHALKAALDAGDCVALLIDRAYGKAKKRFSLFGVESEFPLGHLVLAMRCQVPVITGAIVFDGPEGFRYVHGGIHHPHGGEDDVGELEALQEKCLRDLERIIHDYSDQWFNFQPLARTDPYGS